MSVQLGVSRCLLFTVSATSVFLVGLPLASTALADEAVALEEIVITGSRIRRPDFDTPNPTVSITAESIQLSGTTNLTDYLSSQPALIGSVDTAQTTGSADNAFIGSTGLNLLNLRNLGTDRTLVLVDGRRHVAQLPETAAVDVNTIPVDLIERIDVATGGVSAVYGADAVSGVVNFIMKKNYEGFTARAQYGQSDGGKPVDWHAAVTGGLNFADGRGNIAGSIEHTQEGRLRSRDRSYLRGTNYRTLARNPFDPDDDPAIPDNIPLNDIRYFDSSREGGIDIDIDGVPDLRPDGSPYEIPLFVEPVFSQGGSGTRLADYIGDVLAENENTVASAFLNFEINDKATLFGELKFAHGKSFGVSQPTFDYYLILGEDNPFLSPAIQQAIVDADTGFGGVLLNRDNFDLGVRGEDNKRDTWRTVLGVKGNLSEDLSYEVSYVYGQTKVKNRASNNRWNDRYYAALDVVADPETGDPVCRSNLDPDAIPIQDFSAEFGGGFDIVPYWPNALSFTPGANSGCLPLNLLGEGVADPAAIDWIMFNTLATSKITQNVFTGFLSGSVPGFQLPGGKLSYVVGLEWRRETSKSDPPLENQTGLTFGNVILPTDGDFDVKEVFTEIVLPVLKDRPFAHDLEFNGALRLSDYSTVGKTTTWNLGANWAPIRDVAFRGTLAQSVRAPNIGELFGPQSQTFEFIDDPCDVDRLNNGTQYRAANCAAILSALGIDPETYTDPNSTNIPGLSGGNANLSEETARSWTAGVVLRPRFATGLAIAIDFYDIKIKQAISQAEAQDIADNCVDQPSIDNVFCDALTRDPSDGGIGGFTVQPENVANFRTRGIDFNVNYLIDPADLGAKRDLGTFALTLVGSKLNTLTFIPTPGADVLDERTTQYAPKWVSNVDLTWRRGPLTVNYGYNYFSKTKRYSLNTLAGDPDQASPGNIEYDARRTQDLQLAMDLPAGVQLYAGVNNLTDQKPDLAVSYPVSVRGRFIYGGVKANFGAAR